MLQLFPSACQRARSPIFAVCQAWKAAANIPIAQFIERTCQIGQGLRIEDMSGNDVSAESWGIERIRFAHRTGVAAKRVR